MTLLRMTQMRLFVFPRATRFESGILDALEMVAEEFRFGVRARRRSKQHLHGSAVDPSLYCFRANHRSLVG